MEKIYFDNSSTTFPKPKEVTNMVREIIENSGFNINRGGYNNAYSLEDMVYETRELLSEYFEGCSGDKVVFTKNITEGLNYLIHGFLKEGDHVLISSMEHNAIYRPLNHLLKKKVSYSIIPCDKTGMLDITSIERLIRKNTKAIYLTHCNNVCGTIMPIKEVGEICRKYSLEFFLDSAGSAGIIPVSMKENNISAIAFTGHKGLLGIMGIGGIVFNNDVFKKINPILQGGTGSFSDLKIMPSTMPDKFECGTMNIPAIASLNSSIKWLNKKEDGEILKSELALTKFLIDRILEIDPKEEKIRIVGRKDTKNRIGVLSLQTKTMDIAKLGYILDEKYKIMSRVGLHCNPLAHKALGTYPQGTIRFSFGYNNNINEAEALLKAIKETIYL